MFWIYLAVLLSASLTVFVVQRKSAMIMPGLLAGLLACATSWYLAYWFGSNDDWFRESSETALMVVAELLNSGIILLATIFGWFGATAPFELLDLNSISSDFERWIVLTFGWPVNFSYFWYIFFLLLNILLYAPLRSGVSGFVEVARWLLQRFDFISPYRAKRGSIVSAVHGENAPSFGLFENRTYCILATFVVAATSVLAIFAGILLTVRSFNFGFGPIGLDIVRDNLDDILWTGPHLLFLELLGSVRPPPPIVETPDEPEVRQTERASLPPLVDLYCQRYPGAILAKGELRPVFGAEGGEQETEPTRQAETPSTKHRSVEILLSALEQSYGLPRDRKAELALLLDGFIRGRSSIIFPESFTRLHFRILAALIEFTQDNGGTILIICPDGSLAHIWRTLDEERRHHISHLVQRVCRLDRQEPLASEVFTVIIAPETQIENRLLAQPHEVERFLRRLQLIVVLDLESLDLSMLRLNLSRLGLLLERNALSIVCQSAYFSDMKALADNIFQPSAKASGGEVTINEFEIFSLNADRYATRYWLVWDTHHEHYQDFEDRTEFTGNIGLQTRLIQSVDALAENYETLPLDPSSPIDANSCDQLVDHLHQQTGFSAVAGDLRQLYRRGCVTLTNPGYPVANIEDHGNLLLALERNPNFDLAPEILVNLVADDYPLRDFLIDTVNDMPGRSWGGTGLSPMPPALSGGLSELAHIVRQEILIQKSTNDAEGGAHHRNVDEDRIRHHFGLAPRTLLQQVRITPTKLGLERLFKLLFDRRIKIHHYRDAFHQGTFEIDPSQAAQLQIRSHKTVIYSNRNPAGINLPSGDHGLTYCKGTFFLHDKQWYRIQSVTEADCEVARQNPSLLGGGAPDYVFVRRYHVPLRADETACEDSSVIRRRRGAYIRMRLLHAAYVRSTTAFYQLEKRRRPFEQGNPFPTCQEIEPPIIQRRQFSTLLHLSFTRIPKHWLGNAAEDEVQRRTMIFGFCVALQDLLTSLFPTQAHRIAVVSPQAVQVPFDDTDDQEFEVEEFTLSYYPRFAKEAVGQLVDANIPADVPWWSEDPDGHDSGWDDDELTDADVNDSANEQQYVGFDILIIEDAELDLGIARAVQRRLFPFFLTTCYNYVAWLTNPKRSSTGFHSFGANLEPRLCNFVDVKTLLSHLNR